MKRKTEIVQWKIPTMPDEKKLAKQKDSLLARANSFEITTEDHYIASWPLVQEIDRAYAAFEQLWDPFCKGLDKMHKAACRLRDSFLDPLEAAKDRIMEGPNGRAAWRKKQEKLKEEADKAAAEALRKVQARELEKQAKTLEKQGQVEEAIAVREQKFTMPLFYHNPTPAVPKQQGSVITKRWVYEIVDPDAVQREYCSPDPKKIRPIVESMGEACNIKGLRITPDETESSRTVA